MNKLSIGNLKSRKADLERVFAGRMRELSRDQWRQVLMILLPPVAILLLGLALTYQFVQPAPPRVVHMTTGGEAGAYHAFGKRYVEALAKHGVRLVLHPSAGTLENVQRMRSADTGIAIGLIQGGIVNSKSAPELRSVGRLFLEPIWVFYRSSDTLDRLAGLKGRRIAIGPPGSGTRHLSIELLQRSGVDDTNSVLIAEGGAQAARALREGAVDAIFLAAAPETPLIGELVRDPAIKLMSHANAEAFSRILPYLNRIVLPQGAYDLSRNIPGQDVVMFAPVAALAVREDLHPAIVGLLVEAAQEVHSKGGLFNRVGEFPRAQDPELEMSPDAERYYKQGPSFLKRYLPFWLAIFLERLAVMLVPILTLLIPVVKVVPVVYKWRSLRRLRSWYAQLIALDRWINDDNDGLMREEQKIRLDHIERSVAELEVPLMHSQEYYDLRAAIDLVRQRVAGRLASAAPAAP